MDKVVELNEHNVRPLIGQVLVRRIVEKESRGGIAIPEVAYDTPRRDGTLPKKGTVLRVSNARMIVDVTEEYNKEPEKYGVVIGGLDGHPVPTEAAFTSIPLQVKVGDIVHFNRHGGRNFCEDEELYIIHEREIIAIEEPTDE
jgi:co-chaperonin GroES (HSP10)